MVLIKKGNQKIGGNVWLSM